MILAMSLRTDSLIHPVFTNQTGYFFRNWEYNLDAAQGPLLFTLGLIVIFSISYVAYLLYLKKFTQKPEITVLRDRDKISAILEQSIPERSTYEVQFAGEGTQRAHFTCSPVQFAQGKAIILEMPGFIHPRNEWIGRVVFCFFRVSSGLKEPKWAFYKFQSTVTGVRKAGHLEFIAVLTPQELERSQRRQHLRLDPPSEDIPAVSIRPETLGNLGHQGDQPPLLTFMHGRPDNSLRVVNISGGGLLLEIRQANNQHFAEHLAKGKRLFINLALRDESKNTIKEYFVIARVRNAFTDPKTGHLLIGISFAAHQITLPSDEKKWATLSEQGVEAIEDWVFKKHLQMYREQGVV